MEGGPGRHRPRLAADAQRPAEVGAAEVPDGDPLAALCRGEADAPRWKSPCFSWFWAEDVRIACPPGIDCFMAGEEYNHGGLSLQECVVPQIVIRPGGDGHGFGEDRVVQMGRAALSDQGDRRLRWLHGRPAGQGRRPRNIACRCGEGGRPRMARCALVVTNRNVAQRDRDDAGPPRSRGECP